MRKPPTTEVEYCFAIAAPSMEPHIGRPPPDEFFAHLGTSLEAELFRYDAVIFFETAAVGGIEIEGGNPARIESLEQAVQLDRRLRDMWSKHPRFVFVPHHPSFIKKVNQGLDEVAKIVAHYHQQPAT